MSARNASARSRSRCGKGSRPSSKLALAASQSLSKLPVEIKMKTHEETLDVKTPYGYKAGSLENRRSVFDYIPPEQLVLAQTPFKHSVEQQGLDEYSRSIYSRVDDDSWTPVPTPSHTPGDSSFRKRLEHNANSLSREVSNVPEEISLPQPRIDSQKFKETIEVIEGWEKDSRMAGSQVGVSYFGRKMQKVRPSPIVRIPGLDEPERIVRDAPSLKDLGLPSVESKAEYANLSRWQMGSNDPKNKLAHIKSVQAIIVREGLLLRLDTLLKDIEQQYYEYALLRMQAMDLSIPANAEQIVIQKAKIFQSQVELRVAFANYRTSTLSVFEEITQWRNLCRKDSNIKDANIIMTWHGENYLLKMELDTQQFYRYSVLRMWLDFEPNMLMLPLAQLARSEAEIHGNTSITSSKLFPQPYYMQSLSTNAMFQSPMEYKEMDEQSVMSQVSEVSEVQALTFLNNKYLLFSEWEKKQKLSISRIRSDWIKKKKAEEKKIEAEKFEEAREKREEQDKDRKIFEEIMINFKKEKEERQQQEAVRIKAEEEDGGGGGGGGSECGDQAMGARPRDDSVAAQKAAAEERRLAKQAQRMLDLKAEMKMKEVEDEQRQIKKVRDEKRAEEKAEKKRLDDISKREKIALERQAEEDNFRRVISDTLEQSRRMVAFNVVLNDAVHEGHEKKEWQILRDMCLSSWTISKTDSADAGTQTQESQSRPDLMMSDGTTKRIDPIGGWDQHPGVATAFWTNYELSPLVVEAAIGFKDMWPRDPLVPPLPDKLYKRCAEIRKFLAMEKRKLANLETLRAKGSNLRSSLQSKQDLLAFEGDPDWERKTEGRARDATVPHGLQLQQERLQRRQLTDSNMVDGSLRIYTEIANLSESKAVKPQATSAFQMMRLDWDPSGGAASTTFLESSVILDPIQTHISMERSVLPLTEPSQEFFMTATEGQQDQQDRDDWDMHAHPGRTHTVEKSRSHSRTGILSEEEYANHPLYNKLSSRAALTGDSAIGGVILSEHPTGLEFTRTREDLTEVLEQRVRKERDIVHRTSEGVTEIRPEQQHRRPPDYTRPYWQFRLAQRIQAGVRGAVVRLRLRKAHQATSFMMAVVKIQATFRRLHGVKLYQIKKVKFQEEILVLRNELVRRHHASISITGFIRWCGKVNLGVKTVNALVAYARSAAKKEEKKVKRSKYAQNATKTTTDGTAMTVRPRSRGSERAASSDGNSRPESREVDMRAKTPEVVEVVDADANISNSNSNDWASLKSDMSTISDMGRKQTKKKNTKNIFKGETVSSSRLIPLTVKEGNAASQPGTDKPRFRPFAARSRTFNLDFGRPAPEKTVQHSNECYRPPPALLSKTERQKMLQELERKEKIGNENGVANIANAKLERLKLGLRGHLIKRIQAPREESDMRKAEAKVWEDNGPAENDEVENEKQITELETLAYHIRHEEEERNEDELDEIMQKIERKDKYEVTFEGSEENVHVDRNFDPEQYMNDNLLT